MFDVITSKNTLVIEKVKVLMPYMVDTKIIFDIYYDDRKPLLVQTPVCTLPYSYSLFDNKFFQIDLCFSERDYEETMTALLSIVLNKIKKKFHHLIQDKPLTSPISSIKEGTLYKLRLRNNNVDSVVVFDENRRRIDVRNIERNDRLQSVFQVDRLIINEKNINLNLKVLQLKKKGVTIDLFQNQQCLFVEDQQTDKFERFRKMLKMGIPLMGVKQKMMLDGFTNDDIENFSRSTPIGSGPSPSPPPPPPPPPPALPAPPTPLAFLADIKNGNFVLKKAEINHQDDKRKDKILRLVDTTRLVPSLDDILEARSRLVKKSC